MDRVDIRWRLINGAIVTFVGLEVHLCSFVNPCLTIQISRAVLILDRTRDGIRDNSIYLSS
jgi:hypothetical protein